MDWVRYTEGRQVLYEELSDCFDDVSRLRFQRLSPVPVLLAGAGGILACSFRVLAHPAIRERQISLPTLFASRSQPNALAVAYITYTLRTCSNEAHGLNVISE